MPQRLKYSEENIGLVKTSVENLLKTNPEYHYSVKVSGLVIVPRTRDFSIFDSFREHVNENTDTVTFTNYHGKGNGGETVTLNVNDSGEGEDKNLDGFPRSQGLRGLNERSEIRRQLYAEIQNDFLTQENARLKKEVDKAEKFAREVDIVIGQLNAQRAQTKDKSTWEFLGGIISKLVSSNPELMKNSPALETLMGFLPNSEEKQPPQPPPIDTTLNAPVTIKPKAESAQLDPQTEQLLAVLKKLRRYFSEIEFNQCVELLAAIKDHKELIAPVNAWVNEQIEMKLRWIAQQREAQEQNAPKAEEQQQQEETEPEEKEETEIGSTETTREETKVQYEPYDFEDEQKPYHP